MANHYNENPIKEAIIILTTDKGRQMKNFYCILFLVPFISCKEKPVSYTQTVLENDAVNTSFLKQVQAPEKALISGYLYAYGNECTTGSNKNKCNLLAALHIADECSKTHLEFLKKWFKNDVIMQYKLRNCPNLPHNFAIQNTIDKLVLKRRGDTISIQYAIKGINNSQEKSWNINREDRYLIQSNTLLKIK